MFDNEIILIILLIPIFKSSISFYITITLLIFIIVLTIPIIPLFKFSISCYITIKLLIFIILLLEF